MCHCALAHHNHFMRRPQHSLWDDILSLLANRMGLWPSVQAWPHATTACGRRKQCWKCFKGQHHSSIQTSSLDSSLTIFWERSRPCVNADSCVQLKSYTPTLEACWHVSHHSNFLIKERREKSLEFDISFGHLSSFYKRVLSKYC